MRRAVGDVMTVKNANIIKKKPRIDTPQDIFVTSPSSLKRGRMPVTSKPSDNTSQTIHAGRAIRNAPTNSATATLMRIGLAVTETKPNKIANTPAASTTATDPLRLAGLMDEFILLTRSIACALLPH